MFGLGIIPLRDSVGEKFYEGNPAALLKKAGESESYSSDQEVIAADCDPKLAAICLECINADPHLSRRMEG